MSWIGLPPFISHYNFSRTVGSGTFSVVKEAIDDITGDRVAVKCIPKSKLSTLSDILHFKQEVKVILMLDHPGIIKIRDFLVDSLLLPNHGLLRWRDPSRARYRSRICK